MKYFIFLLFCLFPIRAYAYMDPGTFSIIINAILGFLASIVAYILIFYDRFRLFVKNIYEKYLRKKL